MHPPGEQTGLDDDGVGVVLVQEFANPFPVGGNGAELGVYRLLAIHAGNGLVFAEIDGQNETGVGLKSAVQVQTPSRKMCWCRRATSFSLPNPTAYMDSFDKRDDSWDGA